jgi:hypothetical protein
VAVALAALINYYTEGGAVPTNFSGTSTFLHVVELLLEILYKLSVPVDGKTILVIVSKFLIA